MGEFVATTTDPALTFSFWLVLTLALAPPIASSTFVPVKMRPLRRVIATARPAKYFNG